jgi:hypothetical protein
MNEDEGKEIGFYRFADWNWMLYMELVSGLANDRPWMISIGPFWN